MGTGLRRFSAKNVAIIGAGPSGLTAAKYFLAEKAFTKIDVFEQRNGVGGLWRYTPETSGDGLFEVPQINPRIGHEKPVWTEPQKSVQSIKQGKEKKEQTFLSPIYERLETNIPKSLMRFSEKPFPENVQLFPGHDSVQDYLEEYSKDISYLVQTGTQVTNVQFLDSIEREDQVLEERWSVETLSLDSGRVSKDVYNAVVVASGHYSTPHIPNIPGAKKWNERYPGSMSHSKYYRTPKAFADQKVIVIGNSASGLDISSQLASTCSTPVLVSQKSESYLAGGFARNPDIESVPQITHFNPEDKTIIFSNGRVEKGVDHILFCTGYLYAMPFLSTVSPNPIGNGARVEHTYQHLFYAPHPTLSFLVLPQKIIPFPVSEAQSAVIVRVCSGRLGLPSEHEMEKWEASVINEQGDGGDFHTLKFPKDANYINMLYDWALSAEPHENLEHAGRGKLPRRWGEWEFWARENFPAIRKAFMQKGEDRKHVYTLDMLGFDFENRESNQVNVRQPGNIVTSG